MCCVKIHRSNGVLSTGCCHTPPCLLIIELLKSVMVAVLVNPSPETLGQKPRAISRHFNVSLTKGNTVLVIKERQKLRVNSCITFQGWRTQRDADSDIS